MRSRQGKVALAGERHRGFAEKGADPVDRGAHLGERRLRAVGRHEAAALQQLACGDEFRVDPFRSVAH